MSLWFYDTSLWLYYKSLRFYEKIAVNPRYIAAILQNVPVILYITANLRYVRLILRFIKGNAAVHYNARDCDSTSLQRARLCCVSAVTSAARTDRGLFGFVDPAVPLLCVSATSQKQGICRESISDWAWQAIRLRKGIVQGKTGIIYLHTGVSLSKLMTAMKQCTHWVQRDLAKSLFKTDTLNAAWPCPSVPSFQY